MSKNERQGQVLPPLQRQIVIHLSKAGPQTINKTVTEIKHSYKPSWIAFHSLEKKGIIKKASVKTYRGREYPLFWLSSAGVFIALVEGASAQDLLAKSIETYPDNRVLQGCLELAPFTGIEGYRVALSAILSKGKLEQSDMITMMLTQAQKNLSISQFKQFLETLKKYPEQYEKLKKQIKQLTNFLEKMEEMI